MDVLLLLVPKDRAWGHEGNKGDYAMNAEGRLMRLSNPDAPYIYAGVQIVRPQMYADPALGARFSNLKIFDAAEAKGRLFGLVHDGGWFHFSTPQSLALFQSRQKP
jgi:MurNAc alpha-1-phosphate uridylyltransferase